MDSKGYTRRGVLRAGAVGAAGIAVTGLAGSASAQEDAYDGYLAEEGTWDGLTADARDVDDVLIRVGSDGNGGNFAFDPPVVLVEPGQTVQWEWTGAGGNHNAVHDPQLHDDLVFDSREAHDGDTTSEEGFVYEFTVEEGDEGAHPYVCTPHRGVEMKGVLVVGEENAETELGEYELVEAEDVGPIIMGGAAMFGGISLLGVAAYRELVGSDE